MIKVGAGWFAHARGLATIAATTLAATACSAAPALAQGGGADTAIKNIIPHKRPGNEACFEGTFTDKTVEVAQWLTYAQQKNPPVGTDGKPVAVPSSRELRDQTVSRVALYLKYTNGRRARNESWDLDFTVRVTSPSLGKELFARSGCTWSGWDYEKQKDIEPEFMLSCWIECDGGSMRAVRIPETASLNLFFDRLQMQAGCEGGGTYSVATSEASKKVAFLLERASLSTCKPLKAWDRD